LGFGTGTARPLRAACPVLFRRCDVGVVMPTGMLRRIPPDSVAPLRAAGASGSPVNRHLLHGRSPVDVVLPAGALTDQAHQAHPMPDFTLYEPIRGHIPGAGERGIRSTVSRDQRPLNRRRVLGCCNIRRGRVDVGGEVPRLPITGLAQVDRVPDPVETALMAIAGFPVIRGFDGVVMVGGLRFRGETHRPLRLAMGQQVLEYSLTRSSSTHSRPTLTQHRLIKAEVR